jgi:hypothetical protein
MPLKIKNNTTTLLHNFIRIHDRKIRNLNGINIILMMMREVTVRKILIILIINMTRK